MLPLQGDDRLLLSEPRTSTRQDALDERIGEYALLEKKEEEQQQQARGGERLRRKKRGRGHRSS